ncbi:unnamed protein product, partial [Mesorhabditis belari]|uniref:Tudor domain-containing protein n=1 Tax=Mesorhabditis belari TaxID=2138241 RepID=A0AAF3FJR2_9BILA
MEPPSDLNISQPLPVFEEQSVDFGDDSSLFYFFINASQIKIMKDRTNRHQIKSLDQLRQPFLYNSTENLPDLDTIIGSRTIAEMSTKRYECFLREIEKIGFLNMLKLLDTSSTLFLNNATELWGTLTCINTRHIQVLENEHLRKVRGVEGKQWRLQNIARIDDLQQLLIKNLSRTVNFEGRPIAFVHPCHLLCIEGGENLDTIEYVQQFMNGFSVPLLRNENVDFGTICLLECERGYWARVMALSVINKGLKVVKWKVACVDGGFDGKFLIEAPTHQLFVLPDELSQELLPSSVFLVKLRALAGIQEGMFDFAQQTLEEIVNNPACNKIVVLPKKTSRRVHRFAKLGELYVGDLIPEVDFALYPATSITELEPPLPPLLSDILINNGVFNCTPILCPVANDFWIYKSGRMPPRPHPPMLLGYSDLQFSPPVDAKFCQKALAGEELNTGSLAMFIDPNLRNDFVAKPILQVSPYWLCVDDSEIGWRKSQLAEEAMQSSLSQNTILRRSEIVCGNAMLFYRSNDLLIIRVLVATAKQFEAGKVKSWGVFDLDDPRPTNGDILSEVATENLYALPEALRLANLPARIFLSKIVNEGILNELQKKINDDSKAWMVAKLIDNRLQNRIEFGHATFRDVPECYFYVQSESKNK